MVTSAARSAHADLNRNTVVAPHDTDGDGTDDEVTYFIYAGQAAWQLVEKYPSPVPTWSTTQGEEDHDTSVAKSYVYGNSIDEVLQMRDHVSGEDYFYHQDDLFSVYAMTDEAGAVVERYEYGDYGQVSIMAEDGTSRAASLYGNRHTFTGRLLDDEMTLAGGEQTLQYRHRYIATGNGRFLQRDPLGYHDSANLFSYTSNNPMTFMDPSGKLRCLQNVYYYPNMNYTPQRACDARCITSSWCPHEILRANEASAFAFSVGRACAGSGWLQDGTRCNAIVHCVWSCVMQCRMGPGSGCPKKIGDCHEKCNREPKIRLPYRDQDINNNRIGRNLGKRCPSSSQISARAYCVSACYNAKLQNRPDYRRSPQPLP